jgi:hypothetical protein
MRGSDLDLMNSLAIEFGTLAVLTVADASVAASQWTRQAQQQIVDPSPSLTYKLALLTFDLLAYVGTIK